MAPQPKIKELDTFDWKGVNRRGKSIQGEIKASTVQEAKALLRQQGITPSMVRKKAKALFGSEPKIVPCGHCGRHSANRHNVAGRCAISSVNRSYR